MVEPISASVLAGVLVAELVKAVGKSAGEASLKGAGQVSRKLLSTIRARFHRDEKATKALENFESDPEEYHDVLKKNLERLLKEDPAFRAKMEEVARQGNMLLVSGSGEADMSGIDQYAKGSGHREEVRGSDRARIRGVRQRSEG